MHPPRLDHIFLLVRRRRWRHRRSSATCSSSASPSRSWPTTATNSPPSSSARHTPHDIAFLTGPDGGFHHLAFWVDEWNDLRTAADTCAYHGVTIDAGPTRHGATRGCGLYFFDPAGNRNEVYTGGYHFDPDDEPTVWTEAEMGRAIFSYRGQVDQKFMSVHS